ncbi:MAG: GntR family transcriptional regulator [Eubacteriaceae bacterium]|nr:GntR family transcriptional regulator [Eubacteriaceae bacterium]
MNKLGKVDEIYTVLRQRIINVQYLPGEVLNESMLASEFGMSRTPVREALRRLQQEKWIYSLPKIGMQVAVFDINQLRDLFDAKEALEIINLKLALNKVKSKDIENVKKLLKEMENANLKDTQTIMEIDGRMHHMIWNIADNEFIYMYLEDLQYRLYRCWVYSGMRVGANVDSMQLYDLFKQTLDVLESKDVTKVEDAVKAHIEYHKNDIRRGLI